jgi:hypothetical protein
VRQVLYAKGDDDAKVADAALFAKVADATLAVTGPCAK